MQNHPLKLLLVLGGEIKTLVQFRYLSYFFNSGLTKAWGQSLAEENKNRYATLPLAQLPQPKHLLIPHGCYLKKKSTPTPPTFLCRRIYFDPEIVWSICRSYMQWRIGITLTVAHLDTPAVHTGCHAWVKICTLRAQCAYQKMVIWPRPIHIQLCTCRLYFKIRWPNAWISGSRQMGDYSPELLF